MNGCGRAWGRVWTWSRGVVPVPGSLFCGAVWCALVWCALRWSVSLGFILFEYGDSRIGDQPLVADHNHQLAYFDWSFDLDAFADRDT